jgi:hypothetical protein
MIGTIHGYPASTTLCSRTLRPYFDHNDDDWAWRGLLDLCTKGKGNFSCGRHRFSLF